MMLGQRITGEDTRSIKDLSIFRRNHKSIATFECGRVFPLVVPKSEHKRKD